MKSPNKPLKTCFVPYYDKRFPVKLSRSGYKGKREGFENIKVFNGSELFEIINYKKLKNENVIDSIKVDDALTELKKREFDLTMMDIENRIN